MNSALKQDYPLVLTKVLKALSDPVRLKIVQELIRDEVNDGRHCSSFEALKDLARSTRSHHFKILREAGLISLIDKGNLSLAQLKRVEIEKKYTGLLTILVSDLEL